MVAYLTSHIGGSYKMNGIRIPTQLSTENGKRLFEDITYSDSYGREFYALEDGSYFMIENKMTTLFGAAYLIKDGNIKQICEKDKSICVT